MMLRSLHRFNTLIRPLLVVVLTMVCAEAGAQTPQSVDSLYAELAKATTPADSLPIMNNLFDLTYNLDRKPILYELFETAERAKDYDSMLQTLFLFTSLYQHEPQLEEELIRMSERIPDSEMKQTNLLYIRMRYQATNLNRMSDAERQQQLHQALKDYRDHKRLDKYSRIACLFLICTNLRNTADSEVLAHYLQQLQDMVEEFPEEELAVRTAFYNLAMSTYINNGMYDKAVAATQRMLGLVDKFDKLHESQGRLFRNYDGSLYHCYHNMLVCAQELTDEEVDMYYNRIQKIINTNPRFHRDLAQQHRTLVFYLMAKKRYAEAIPELLSQLNANLNQPDYFRYTEALVKAARATDNKEALLKGSRIINDIYRERLKSKSDVSLSELQTIYDIDHLKDRNRDLTFENQRIAIARKEQTIIAVVVMAVILVCALIWMISLYLRSRTLAQRLSDANTKLVNERNSLQEIYARLMEVRDKAKAADRIKSDFVENMSSEIKEPLGAIVEYSQRIANSAKQDGRAYLGEYVHALNVNTDMLIRLVTDVLDLRLIESGDLNIVRAPASVNNMCALALDHVKKHLAHDVDIIFTNTGQPDTIIFTDAKRVEQILIQILTNAAKFTEEGTITFGYKIKTTDNTIEFAVADTGIGIPEGMEERIFDRFVKVDSSTQGNGLGLYLARLLAEILGGSISLDSSYHNGARFLFTIPLGQATETKK